MYDRISVQSSAGSGGRVVEVLMLRGLLRKGEREGASELLYASNSQLNYGSGAEISLA